MFRITKDIDKAQLIFNVEKLGDDYLLSLTGGKEHIGAVAVGLFDEKSQRSSSSVISLPGHRDEQIALEGSKLVSKVTHKTTVFIVGIHIDDINAEEIRNIISVSGEMVKSFINYYEKTDESLEQK